MNKIYKVVWNKARNCYVVASEFAKNHQTGSSRIKAASVAAVMAATMLTIGTGVIYADNVAVKDREVKGIAEKQTILYKNTEDETTKLNDPNLEHYLPGSWVHEHTAACGELTYNTTLTIGDINKVVDRLVENDKSLYDQGIKNVTMENGTISLMRNNGDPVKNNIVLTGNDGKDGKDTSVTVTVGDQSQTFKTGSIVTATKDANGNATELKINGNSYGIKAGKTYKAGDNVTIADDGTISAKDTTYSAGDNVKIDDKNKISVDLSKYAKSDDVAVVYQDNDKNKSLHSTNAGTVGSSSIALGKEATTGMSSVALGDQTKATGERSTAIGVKAEATALDSIAIGGGTKATGGDSIAIGNATTANSQYSVAIGDDIQFTGTSATAVGQQAHATGDYSTALGSMTNVDADWNGQHPGEWRKSGTQSTAIGYGSGSWGDYSTALGAFAKTENQFSSAIGYNSQATAENAIALGAVAKAEGKFATAIGTSSQATAENTVALGGAAKANVSGGVALGTSSVADRAKGKKGAFAPTQINATDQSTWTSTMGAVSVGDTKNNITRQITNVAAGTEATDAVNVAQLKTAKTEVKAGTNITSVDKTTGANGQDIYTINAKDTTYAAGNGIAINGENNAISVKLKEGENNLEVTADGLALNKELTGLTSVTTQNAYVTNVDASKNESVTNVGYVNNQIAGVTLTEGKGISITDKKINVKLKDGEQNLVVNNDGLSMNTTLKGIQSITGAGTGAGSISFEGSNVKVNQNTFNSDGRIQGVVAGKDNTDAVNVGQLKDVVAAGDTDVHIQAGNYTVDKNNKVSMNLVDKAGNDKGTVTITGVAKAEDVAVVYDQNKTSLRSTNASVAENAIALGKGASAVKDSVAIGNGASVVAGSNGSSGVALGYKAHAGYKGTSLGSNAISGREGTTLVGANTNSGSLYTTVVGTDSVINSSGVKYLGTVNVQGATATVVGSKNTVDNQNNKVYSGVANNIMGAANTIKSSNGITIQGSGNTVTDAYKDMDIDLWGDGFAILGGDYSVLAKKQSGAVAVVGGANTVSKQTDSTVIGYDNKLIGDKEKGSHDVFMAGSHNKLNNVSDSIVMGNENAITGVSNVISFGHKNAITANNAVAIGNGAGVSVEGGVALGVGSVANRAAGKVVGYDPTTGKAYDIENGDAPDYVWKATKGAVSVGDTENNITRQITNVAAGTGATDAVNVAQLKAATENAGWNLSTGKEITNPTKVKSGATVDFSGDDGNITVSKEETDYATLVNVKLNRNLNVDSVQAGDFFMNNDKGIGYGGEAYVTREGLNANDKVITNVAKGVYNTDAVNVGQLKEVGEVAANANKGWNLSTNGVATEATNVKPGGYVDFSGDKNISVSHDGTKVKVELNKDLVGIESISNGDAKMALNGAAGTAGMINGKGASIYMQDGYTVINSKVAFDQNGKISGVATGAVTADSTDAVNGSQLHAVQSIANKGWNLTTAHGGTTTTVKPGDTVDFSPEDTNLTVTNEGTNVKIGLNQDLHLTSATFGDTTINANGLTIGHGTAGLEFSQNRVSVGGQQIHDVADGIDDMDAVNVNQLNKVKETANKGWNLTTAHGETTTVKPGDTVDFSPEDTNLTVTNEGTNVKIGLNQDLHLTSATFGDTIINANGLTIGHGTAGLEFSQNRVSVGGQQIHDVADGKDNTDAVNVGQLKQVADAATSNDKRLVQNPNDSDGSYQVKENGDVTLRVEDSNKNGYNVTIKDVASKAELDKVKTDVGNVDGFHDEIKNKDTNGKPTHTSVVDAVNNLDTKVNTIQSDVTKATEEAKKHSSVSTGNGLDLDVTDNNGQKDYKVSLKDDFTLGGKDGHTGSIEFKGSEGNITASGTLTANAVSVGNTSISDTGLQIGNKTSLTEDALTIGGNTYITDKGIDANQQKISNVADGDISKDSKDAVNGSQLYATNEAIANNYNNITNLNGRISNLDNRVNKVGAGAAALAALHPLDFDPDAKWDFAAGYGNYRGANAAAVGAYYRPNEDTMFSVGGTFGNGENMVNAGVSFKLGSGSSHVSTSRVAMAKEIKELRGELEAMKSAMLDANAGKKIDTSKLQLFPDVPQNHWAYEYVAQLAGNGMIEGYPDGNFAGDRPMTRYEFAAILYRAMTKGAVLSDKILSEFSHELEYFTVDTIAKDKAGNPTIQRVRTVKENKNK